jgi:uncharacterized protein YggE
MVMRERWAKVFVVVLVMMFGGMAFGEGSAGIVVVGTGTAKARPTHVEIDCSISGEAELAADATVKFRDAKKRAVAAIAGMKNSDISVESGGLSVNNVMDAASQMMMMRGQGGTSNKPRVQILEKSKIVLANADKMEPDALLDLVLKVLDVAKDAGFQVGPPPANSNNYYEQQLRAFMGTAVVAFRLPDAKKLREEAYKAAVADAREKAEQLAELSGVKLGKVIAVQEVQPVKNESGSSSMGNPYMFAMEMMSKLSTPEEKGVTGNTTGELSTKVNLTVTFEIAK